jgi:hypothetical protein
MIWVAWRQFRTQALVALGLLVALAALLLATGLHVRACHPQSGCDVAASARPVADILGPVLLAVPALLGMFWGAPLVARELESGTYRLAWTQSVTRRKWLLVRVALVGVAAIAVAGLATLLVSWWFAPIDAFNGNRFNPSVFGERGIVAIGYAGFAFALGVAAGTLTRRTLPAMVTTLLGFVGARIAFTLWARPHLPGTTQHVFSVVFGKGLEIGGGPFGLSAAAGEPPLPNAWILTTTLVDRARRVLTAAQQHDLLVRYCPRLAASKTPDPLPCQQTLSHHLGLLVTYHPAGNFWPLQALETGIFLAAGLALIGATIWRIGPRAARNSAAGVAHERAARPLVTERS